MSIKVTANFWLGVKQHLDARAICDTLADLNAMNVNIVPYGMLVFCLEDETTYKLCKGDIWEKVIIDGSLGAPPDIEKFIFELDTVTGLVDTTKPLFVKEGEIEVHTKDDLYAMMGQDTKDILDNAGNLLDDSNITDDKTWSSKKIYDELQVTLAKANKYSDDQMASVTKPPFEIVTDEGLMVFSDRFYLLDDGQGNFNIYVVGNDGTPIKISNTEIDLSELLTLLRAEEVDRVLLDAPATPGTEGQLIAMNATNDATEWVDNADVSELATLEYVEDIEEKKILKPIVPGEAEQYLTIHTDKSVVWSDWDAIFSESIYPDEYNNYQLTLSGYQICNDIPAECGLLLPSSNKSFEINLYMQPADYAIMNIPTDVTMVGGDNVVSLCKGIIYKLSLKYVKNTNSWIGRMYEYGKSPAQIAYFVTTNGINALSTKGSEANVQVFKNGYQVSVVNEEPDKSVNMLFNNLGNVTSVVIDGAKLSNLSFSGCSNLESVVIRNADFSGMTDYSRMFMNCPKLTKLTFENVNIPDNPTYTFMFTNTENIKYSDITVINCNANLTNMLKAALTPTISIKYASAGDVVGVLSNSDVAVKIVNGYNVYSFDGQAPISLVNAAGNTNITSVIIENATINNTTMAMFEGCTGITDVVFKNTYFNGSHSMARMFYGCSAMTTADVSTMGVDLCTNMNDMFNGCSVMTTTGDLSGWGVNNVENFSGMFSGCAKLKNIGDVSTWNTASATDMSSMFNGCSVITTLPVGNWNTANVTNMANMFQDCATMAIIDVSGWNTGNVTDMSRMFRGCAGLTEITGLANWDTSKVTDMGWLFANNDTVSGQTMKIADLSGIEGWNVSSVTSMRAMLQNQRVITSLDLSGWNTGRVTDMSYMFFNCIALTDPVGLSNWDTSKVTDMSYMFYQCIALTNPDLSNWNTALVTNFSSILEGCTLLETLNLAGWEISESATYTDMLKDHGKLTFGKVDKTLCNDYTISVIRSFFPGVMYVVSSSTTAPYTVTAANSGDTLTTNTRTYTTTNYNGTSRYLHTYTFDYDKPIRIEIASTTTRPQVYDVFIADGTLGRILNTECTNLTRFEDGGMDMSKCTSLSGAFYGCSSLTEVVGITDWDLTSCTEMNQIFDGCSKLTNLDLSGWHNTGNVITTSNMFYNCALLESVGDLSGLDTSSVINMYQMFYNCQKLTSIGDVSGWDTSSANDMGCMFQRCYILDGIDGVSKWNISKVTAMPYMFYGCKAIESLDLSGWTTSQVNNMAYMFNDTNFKELNLDGWVIPSTYGYFLSNHGQLRYKKVSKLNCSDTTKNRILEFFPRKIEVITTDTTSPVSGATPNGSASASYTAVTGGYKWTVTQPSTTNSSDYLRFSSNNVKEIKVVEGNFSGSGLQNLGGSICTKVDFGTIDDIDTTYVTSFSYLLSGCSNLTEVIGLENYISQPTGLTNTAYMFNSCNKLTSIDISAICDTSKVTDMNRMFLYCHALTEIKGLDRLNTSSVISMSNMFSDCYAINDLSDIYGWDVSKVTDMSYMFDMCYELEALDLASWNVTTALTNMAGMFRMCYSLESLDISGWNTSKVTDATRTFRSLFNVKSVNLSGIDLSAATSYSELFSYHGDLQWEDVITTGCNDTTINRLYTYFKGVISLYASSANVYLESSTYMSKATDLLGIGPDIVKYLPNDRFKNSTSTVYLHEYRYTGDGTNNQKGYFNPGQDGTNGFHKNNLEVRITNAFPIYRLRLYSSSNLQAFTMAERAGAEMLQKDCWTNLSDMFSGCNNLVDISGCKYMNTANVTDMGSTFSSCYTLQDFSPIADWNTAKVTTMGNMFNNCQSAKSIPTAKFNTSACTDMGQMFMYCYALENAEVADFDVSKVTNISSMFAMCYHLEDIPTSTWNAPLVTSIYQMFHSCYSLKTIDLKFLAPAGTKLTNVSYMLYACIALESVDMSGVDLSAASYDYAFSLHGDLQRKNVITDGCNTATINKVEAFLNRGTMYVICTSQPTFSTLENMTVSTPYLVNMSRVPWSEYYVSDTASATVQMYEYRHNGGSTNAFSTSYKANIRCTATAESSKILEIRVTQPFWINIFEIEASKTLKSYTMHEDAGRAIRANSTYYASMNGDLSGNTALVDASAVQYYNTSNVTDMNWLFSGCTSLKELPDLSKWDTSKVTSMGSMFSGCKSLTELPNISGWNTSKVTSMSNMFTKCSSLTDISQIYNWDVSGVTYMSNIFQECSALTSIDLSAWTNSKINSMNSMFGNCTNLASVTFGSNFNTALVTDMASTFYGCSALSSLDLSTFNTAAVTTFSQMFNNTNLASLNISNFRIDSSDTTTNMLMNHGQLTLDNIDMTNCDDTTKSKVAAFF